MEQFFIGIFGSEYIQQLLTPAMVKQYFQFALVAGAIWALVVRKVSDHFKGMKESVDTVGRKLDRFIDVVEKDLQSGEQRMKALEEALVPLRDIPTRVERLEHNFPNLSSPVIEA